MMDAIMTPGTNAQGARLGRMLVLAMVGAAAGCGGGSTTPGSGGSTGTGGGSNGTGGTVGTGGSASGGSGAGSGGTSASGGVSGGSGGAASGGSAATGGASSGTGGGGAVGSGGRGAATGGTVGATGGATTGSGGAAGGATGAGCLDFKTPTQVGTIANTTLNGPSGMVASRAHPGVLYAHLDTGGPATIFAMTAAGKDLGQYALMGATNTDWEDISIGNGPAAGSYIYVGDFGDNSSNRTQIQVYRVPEPDVTTTQAVAMQNLTNWQVLRFTYPDMAHNAETLMVDPVSGDILILTKDSNGMSTLFRALGTTAADTPTVLEKVTTVQIGASGQAAQASGGDISPTGDRILVRTYATILLWPRGTTWATTFSATPKSLPMLSEPQSEGITFSADGKAWLSTGEQARPIYQGDANCP